MHGDAAAELHEKDELTLFFTGQLERNARPTEQEPFNVAMRGLLSRLPKASASRKVELQREIDLLVVGRAEKIAEQREAIARKAGLMQAGKRVRT